MSTPGGEDKRAARRAFERQWLRWKLDNLSLLALRRGHIRPETPIEPWQEGYIPLLPAYKNRAGNLEVWCVWCRRWHIHGAKGGHRVAHCVTPLSRYHNGGYVIVEVGPMTREARDARRQDARLGPVVRLLS